MKTRTSSNNQKFFIKIIHMLSILFLLLISVSVMGNITVKKVRAVTTTPSLTAPSRPTLPTATMVSASDPATYGYQSSIASQLTKDKGTTQIVLYSSTTQTGTLKKEFSGTVTVANLQSATAKVVSNNNSNLYYVLYIGGNLSVPSTIHWTSQYSNGVNNFEAMNKKAKSITLVNNPADPTNSSNTQAPGTNYTLTLETGDFGSGNGEPEIYLGCNTVFRNFTFQSSTPTAAGTAYNSAGAGKVSIYAQGNKFAMDRGAWGLSTLNLIGASKNSNVDWTSTDSSVNHGAGQAGTNLWVASTGVAGTQVLAGIDTTSWATVNGDAHATVVGVGSGGINYYEGTNNGTINGSIYNDIRVTSGNSFITNIWGGGNVGFVNGNVVTSVNNSVPLTMNTYYGGFNSTGVYATGDNKVTGTIYNTISGQGKWGGSFGYFVGGTRYGTIGTSGVTSNSISNNFDSSSFSSGDALFVGGNDRAYSASGQGTGLSQGNIYGNVINYVKSGYTTGRIIGVTGVFGMHFNSLYGPSSGLSTNSSYSYSPTQPEVNNFVNNTSSALADANVAASADGKLGALYGNAYTYLQSGVMSLPSVGSTLEDPTAAYTRGGGFVGYIKGNTTVELGTSNGSNVGGTGLVTAGGWTGSTTGTISYSQQQNGNLSSVSGYSISGGGGTTARAPLGYFQTGQATVVQNNVIADSIFGGNIGGILNGSSLNKVNAGITSTSAGGGFNDVAQLGNTELDVYNSQIDGQAVAAGLSTMGMAGNADAIFRSTVFANGSIYGYVGMANGILKGNTSVNIAETNLNGTPASGAKVISGGSYNGSVLGNASLDVSMGTSTSGAQTTALPANTILAGSGVPGQVGGVGSGISNSVSLNINSSNGSWLNNSVTIYGDASNGSQTNLGQNQISVNAPGAAMSGKILSTGYNLSSLTNPVGKTGLSQNTSINLNALTSVASVSAGGDNDNFTNSMPLNNNQAVINVGNSTAQTIISNKITSFTQINVTKGTNLTLNNAGLLNGGTNSTAQNHGANYSNFGNLVLGEGSNLVLSKNTTLASLAKLTVQGTAGLTSAYSTTAGQVNLSDFDPSNGKLEWKPNGTQTIFVDPTNPNNINASTVYNGNWNGKQMGYVVLTFTGGNSASGASKIKEPSVTSAYDVQSAATSGTSNFYTLAKDGGGNAMFGDDDLTTYATSGLNITGNMPTYLGIVSPPGAQSFIAPNDFEFGRYSTAEAVKTSSIYTGFLATEDTRFSKWAAASPMNVLVSATPLKNDTGSITMDNYSLYYQNGVGKQIPITSSSNSVFLADGTEWGYQNITTKDKWINNNSSNKGSTITGSGINFSVLANQAQATNYSATLTWTIANNTPSSTSIIQ